MKLFSNFKKEKKSNLQFNEIEKSKLAKLIGGGDGYDDAVAASNVLKTKHDTAKNAIGNIR